MPNGNNLPQISMVGATPFFLAAAGGDVNAMKTLVEGRANPKLVTENGVSPLMVAAGAAGQSPGRKVFSDRVMETTLSGFCFG